MLRFARFFWDIICHISHRDAEKQKSKTVPLNKKTFGTNPLKMIILRIQDWLTEGVALTFWMFHARTVPSVEALQTVALMFQRWGSWAEFPCRYTNPTTLPVGQHVSDIEMTDKATQRRFHGERHTRLTCVSSEAFACVTSRPAFRHLRF